MFSDNFISDHFDVRTRVHMEMALERVCEGRWGGESHALRRAVAESIIRCAANGRTAFGQLVDAGERALIQLQPDKKSA